jgi:hypothetical protein
MNECVICLESIQDDNITLECGHKFHNYCVSNWLKNQQSCPICRTMVFNNNENTNISNVQEIPGQDDHFINIVDTNEVVQTTTTYTLKIIFAINSIYIGCRSLIIYKKIDIYEIFYAFLPLFYVKKFTQTLFGGILLFTILMSEDMICYNKILCIEKMIFSVSVVVQYLIITRTF